jgi:serine phosphatase RsbU (regulator of sigma subunit)
MSLVQNLLLLYVGVVAISALLSAALWWKSRDTLRRDLLFVWAASIFSFAAQGALTKGTLAIVLGFSSAFVSNLAIANLTSSLVHTRLRWKPFAAALVLANLLAVLFDRAGLRFVYVALPVSLAVAAPLLFTNLRATITRWRSLTVSGKALLVSGFLFCLHNLDYAFLRDRPEAAGLGFTLATLIIFALSITAPASVLELVAQREARASVEVESARRIQTRLLPNDTTLCDLEFVCHMRPASVVGGDYFDIHRAGDRIWFFVGDVTGHGLGAGLVTLMAQSIVQSILATRPNVTPRELNWIANRVLGENLMRLQEQRHMTMVSVCKVSANRFEISGSHDNIYVYRAHSREVEIVPLAHFPLGLGFLPELAPQDVHQFDLTLASGDVLFVGTDGITEAARGGDETKELFGESGLVSFLEAQGRRPLADLKTDLIAALEHFTAGVYHDDVAFMALRSTGAA